MKAMTTTNVHRWKRGDQHPETRLIFWAYDRGREWWKTPEQIKAAREQFNLLQRERRARNPEKSRAETRKWQRLHRDQLIKYQREKYAANPEAARKVARRWREANREKARSSVRAWFKKNPDYAKRYAVNRRKKDAHYRISKLLRDRLRAALKGKLRERKRNGIDAVAIVRWFEWLHRNGHAPSIMHPGVEIDHTIPLNAFSDLTSSQEVAKANHWRNLFPMMKQENVRKSAKIDREHIRRAWRLADQFIYEMRNRYKGVPIA